jgi:hypothetical protein
MEDRTFLQMHKTTSESKVLLRDFSKRSENSNLYRHHHLLLSNDIIKSKLKSARSNYEILQIFGVALLDKIPLKELLSNPIYQDVKEQNYIQLNLDLF